MKVCEEDDQSFTYNFLKAGLICWLQQIVI